MRRKGTHPSRSGVIGGYARAFTLVELIVTLAIIATLVSLMLPALRGAISAARNHQCQNHQRKIGIDFWVFADQSTHADWGDDSRSPGFRLATFIESQYGIDEFWADGPTRETELNADHIMQCAEVGKVQKIGALPCDSGGLRDPSALSYAFNFRLAKSDSARPMRGTYKLNHMILQRPMVPLSFDIDGDLAVSKGVTVDATYGAPSLGTQGIMSGDRYWSPATRHSGKSNVSFTDGSVQSARDLLATNSWRWDYMPPGR